MEAKGDLATEISNKLRIMQQVIGKQEQFTKKREVKYIGKQGGKTPQKSTEGNIVAQIFDPASSTFKGATPVLALDCEMVQTQSSSDSLARVSIVNYNGHTVYDKYVRPESRVIDYRTWVSGVTSHNLKEENGAIPL